MWALIQENSHSTILIRLFNVTYITSNRKDVRCIFPTLSLSVTRSHVVMQGTRRNWPMITQEVQHLKTSWKARTELYNVILNFVFFIFIFSLFFSRHAGSELDNTEPYDSYLLLQQLWHAFSCTIKYSNCELIGSKIQSVGMTRVPVRQNTWYQNNNGK